MLSRYPVRQSVLVNTKTEKTFRGVLWSTNREFLVLRNAELMERNNATPIDGEVLVRKENIDFLQVT